MSDLELAKLTRSLTGIHASLLTIADLLADGKKDAKKIYDKHRLSLLDPQERQRQASLQQKATLSNSNSAMGMHAMRKMCQFMPPPSPRNGGVGAVSAPML